MKELSSTERMENLKRTIETSPELDALIALAGKMGDGGRVYLMQKIRDNLAK